MRVRDRKGEMRRESKYGGNREKNWSGSKNMTVLLIAIS